MFAQDFYNAAQAGLSRADSTKLSKACKDSRLAASTVAKQVAAKIIEAKQGGRSEEEAVELIRVLSLFWLRVMEMEAKATA